MNANDVASEGLRLISRLAGAVVAVPVITGYVALGAAVAIGRSLLDRARQTWKWPPSLRGSQRYQEPRAPKAAQGVDAPCRLIPMPSLPWCATARGGADRPSRSR